MNFVGQTVLAIAGIILVFHIIQWTTGWGSGSLGWLQPGASISPILAASGAALPARWLH